MSSNRFARLAALAVSAILAWSLPAQGQVKTAALLTAPAEAQDIHDRHATGPLASLSVTFRNGLLSVHAVGVERGHVLSEIAQQVGIRIRADGTSPRERVATSFQNVPRLPRAAVKIFSLQNVDAETSGDVPELGEPFVYGLSWRFRWRAIEPQEGHYNWRAVDRVVDRAAAAGKKVMLRVVAGIHSPEWLYQSGAQSFAFSNRDVFYPQNYPSRNTMPVPWDDTFLAKWQTFIVKFGKRYNGHPHVYSVHMAGGGHIGEMNLPRAPERWREVGYTDERLIAAWKRIIATYRQAFPETPTNLNIGVVLRGSTVVGPVVSHALETYPGKVYVQYNGLRADFDRAGPFRAIIREASNTTVVGYQMLGGRGFVEKETGDRAVAFRNALADRVSYVEVYATDVRDPKYRHALEMLARGEV